MIPADQRDGATRYINENLTMKFKPGEPRPANAGRKAGTPNRHTALLKDAILAAAEKAGKGDIVAYLERQAEENPVAFLSLLARVLPLQLRGDSDNPLVIRRVEYVIVDPKEPQPNRSGDGQIIDAQRDRDRALALPRQAQRCVDG